MEQTWRGRLDGGDHFWIMMRWKKLCKHSPKQPHENCFHFRRSLLRQWTAWGAENDTSICSSSISRYQNFTFLDRTCDESWCCTITGKALMYGLPRCPVSSFQNQALTRRWCWCSKEVIHYSLLGTDESTFRSLTVNWLHLKERL